MENNYLEQYYRNYDEEGRLLLKYGQVEYITTMKYIHKYLQKGMRILEVGVGTGRYTLALAQEGYQVDAVELTYHNLSILKSKLKETDFVTAIQGNALDLSVYKENTYDITLILGPMYHLYQDEDKRKVLKEAIRVTKKGGHIFVAYCMNEAAIISHGFKNNQIKSYIEKKMITEDFHCKSKPEDVFELVRIEDIKRLTEDMPVQREYIIATDGATNYMRDIISNMDDETFELFVKYHLATCERQDLIGASHHSLDIIRKE